MMVKGIGCIINYLHLYCSWNILDVPKLFKFLTKTSFNSSVAIGAECTVGIVLNVSEMLDLFLKTINFFVLKSPASHSIVDNYHARNVIIAMNRCFHSLFESVLCKTVLFLTIRGNVSHLLVLFVEFLL